MFSKAVAYAAAFYVDTAAFYVDTGLDLFLTVCYNNLCIKIERSVV